MSQINLKVQIHCIRPSWINYEKNKYRLYVNEDLLTERSWIWDIKTYIDENIWVELEPDIAHLIKIVPVLDPADSFAKFTIKKLRINENLYSYENENEEQLEISFRI